MIFLLLHLLFTFGNEYFISFFPFCCCCYWGGGREGEERSWWGGGGYSMTDGHNFQLNFNRIIALPPVPRRLFISFESFNIALTLNWIKTAIGESNESIVQSIQSAPAAQRHLSLDSARFFFLIFPNSITRRNISLADFFFVILVFSISIFQSRGVDKKKGKEIKTVTPPRPVDGRAVANPAGLGL